MRPVDWTPLAERDPVPGDVFEVAMLARRYGATAEVIAEQAASLRRLGEEGGSAWDSDAGRVFAEHARELSGEVARAHGRYAAAAETLNTWARELDAAQVEAEAALAQAKDAAARAAAAAPPPAAWGSVPVPAGAAVFPSPADTDPTAAAAERRRVAAADEAAADLAAARARLERAVEHYSGSAGRLARQLRDVSEHDGLKDSRWDRFKGWVSDHADVLHYVAEIAGAVALVASVASLVLGWVPVLGQVLIAVAVLATAVSLVSHAMLASAGEGSWVAVGLDIVALASFGTARLAMGPSAVRGLVAGQRSARTLRTADEAVTELSGQAVSRGIATERNAANFYSSGNRPFARKAAEGAADDLGATTLERTPGGRWLDEARLFDDEASILTKEQAAKVWERTSDAYARQASGDVRAFVDGAAKPSSVFHSVELPALREGLATGRISSVTIENITTGQSTVLRMGPTATSDVATTLGAASTIGSAEASQEGR